MVCRLCVSDYDPTQFEYQLSRSFNPLITCIKKVVIKTAYAILVAAASSLIVHIASFIVSHHLSNAQTKYSARTRSASPVVENHTHHHDDTDYECDDNEIGFDGSPLSVNRSTEAAACATLLPTTDFKYTETKV